MTLPECGFLMNVISVSVLMNSISIILVIGSNVSIIDRFIHLTNNTIAKNSENFN